MIVLSAALASGSAAPLCAQDFPTRPITIVVPFTAGGPTDVLARILGEGLARLLHQPIAYDNTTGAAGTVGVAKVVHAPADGYTIGIGHVGTHVASSIVYRKLGYDVLADLEPIALLPRNPMLVVSANQVPARTLKELVEYLNANGGRSWGGTAGVGSGSHLGGLAFFAATGTKYQLVPYRGTGPAMKDLIANQIQVMVDQALNSLPQVREGKIRAYAVTAPTRMTSAPDVPSAAEAGYAGLDVSIWHGLWAPKGTPDTVIKKLNAAVAATLADPDIRARLEKLGQQIPPPERMTPAALAAFQRAELERWRPLLADVKID